MGLNAFQEMVRTRLRERTPNFSLLARFLKVDNSTIQKRLKSGGSALCLDWLDEVASWYQMSVSEMTALPGSPWQEVKPLEAQLLGHFRAMTEHERYGLLAVLSRQPASVRRSRSHAGRHLTDEEQELVDLFFRVKIDGVRKGVLKTLRGAAQDDATVEPPHTPG